MPGHLPVAAYLVFRAGVRACYTEDEKFSSRREPQRAEQNLCGLTMHR